MWHQTINASKVTEQGSKRHTDQLVMEKLTNVQINGQDYGGYYHSAQFEKEWGVGFGILEARVDFNSIKVKYDNGVVYLESALQSHEKAIFKRDSFVKPISTNVFHRFLGDINAIV